MPFAKWQVDEMTEHRRQKKLILFQIWQQGIGGRTSGVGSESDESVPAFPVFLTTSAAAATATATATTPGQNAVQSFALVTSCSPRHSGKFESVILRFLYTNDFTVRFSRL
jgi:hypothetical protein